MFALFYFYLKEILGLYFLLSIALTALFIRYVSTDAFVSLFGNNNGFGVLMATTIGIPLYACGSGIIPLLKQWLHYGNYAWDEAFSAL